MENVAEGADTLGNTARGAGYQKTLHKGQVLANTARGTVYRQTPQEERFQRSLEVFHICSGEGDQSPKLCRVIYLYLGNDSPPRRRIKFPKFENL